VGAVLPNLNVVNQEDTTNTAIRAWKAMRCFRFSLTDHPAVNHFALPTNASVLRQMIAAARPRSRCR
jgi:lecithin-cholesterol acyltransferase